MAEIPLRFVMRIPSGRDDREEMPLVVVLHGRGADANDLADLAPMIDGPSGYRFIFPNAPKPFEPYPGMTFGWTWFDGLPPDRKSFAASRDLLLRFLDHVVIQYRTPKEKIVLAGFSQGAVMVLDAGFRWSQRPAGVVAMSGALFEDDAPDIKARADLPLLIVHGTEDDMIPVHAARRARRVLENAGVHPEYHEFPMGHHVTQESMEVVRDFVSRCLE